MNSTILKFLKNTIPFTIIISLYLIYGFYKDFAFYKNEISETIKEIRNGRGGKHYYYTRDSFKLRMIFLKNEI